MPLSPTGSFKLPKDLLGFIGRLAEHPNVAIEARLARLEHSGGWRQPSTRPEIAARQDTVGLAMDLIFAVTQHTAIGDPDLFCEASPCKQAEQQSVPSSEPNRPTAHSHFGLSNEH